MATIEISSSDFRGKMGAMFDRADRGEHIVIKRKNRFFALEPLGAEVDNEELSISQIAFINEGLESIRRGEGKEYSLEELRIKMGL